MYQKIECGDKLYVWTVGGVKPSGNSECVISAHGGQSIINSRFRVEDGQEFVFYAPHGYTLRDPSLLNVLLGDVIEAERIQSKQCPDYGLGKYQGAKHGSANEKYSDIERAGATDEEMMELGFTAEQLSTRRRPLPMDIVTIRHRRLRTEPSLHEVVQDLKKHGWSYKVIHCSFCRGTSLPWKSDAGAWDAIKGQAAPD